MEKGNYALVLRPDFRPVLGSSVDLFRTLKWPAEDGKPEPLCLVCEDVDFSGTFTKADVEAKDGSDPFRIWVPHGAILVCFDFEESHSIGFLRQD